MMWYLARSAGMAAAVLMIGALVLGILAATRALKDIDRPAWLIALHRWFSVLTVIAVATHLVALVADSYVHFGLVELLVPGTSAWRPLAVSLGVVALYLFAVVHVSSLAMKRLPKVWWRRLHVLSYLSVWAALLHGGTAGTDTSNVVYRAVATLLTMAAVTAVLFRVVLGRFAVRATGRRSSTGEAEGADRRRPRPARGVDQVEVVVASDVHDGDGAGAGGNRVGGGHVDVGAAADHRDGDAVGDARGGDGVALGDLVGEATEEVDDGTAADTVASRVRQRGDGCEADGDARLDDRIAALRARRQQRPRGEPQREVPAGGVPDDGGAVGVEAAVGADRGE